MKHSKEAIEKAVKESFTWADVCRKLGVKPMSGSQSYLKKRAIEMGIDDSHFLGQASNRGKTFTRRDAKEYCYKGSKEGSHRLKKKLIRDGYKKAICEICGLSEWRGDDLPLELDHKDSDHYNNEISNLQIICPNCHAVETRKRRSCSPTGRRQTP